MIRFALLAVVFSGAAVAQPQVAFEVAAIKPAPPPSPEAIRSGTLCVGMRVEGGRAKICGYSPVSLLATAFRVPMQQVVAPELVRGLYFDIEAKLPEGATKDQVPEMLQAMLAERFKLTYHRETRDYQFSVLSVGKNGMKLPRLPDDAKGTSTSTRLADGSTRMTQVGNIASLFAVMNSFGGLQMADETGLTGLYEWVRVLPPPGQGATSFQEIMQQSFRDMIESAGLRLETRKVAKETIVVEHIEKTPTEN